MRCVVCSSPQVCPHQIFCNAHDLSHILEDVMQYTDGLSTQVCTPESFEEYCRESRLSITSRKNWMRCGLVLVKHDMTNRASQGHVQNCPCTLSEEDRRRLHSAGTPSTQCSFRMRRSSRSGAFQSLGNGLGQFRTFWLRDGLNPGRSTCCLFLALPSCLSGYVSAYLASS